MKERGLSKSNTSTFAKIIVIATSLDFSVPGTIPCLMYFTSLNLHYTSERNKLLCPFDKGGKWVTKRLRSLSKVKPVVTELELKPRSLAPGTLSPWPLHCFAREAGSRTRPPSFLPVPIPQCQQLITSGPKWTHLYPHPHPCPVAPLQIPSKANPDTSCICKYSCVHL